ncbi:MAG TPA: sulfite exporter TauE/SafE family protein, partial [Acidimicrobiales bacterium]|nr:sulfite exporter TauE/SafE family protein [Acidimicrobiales bacterium]
MHIDGFIVLGSALVGLLVGMTGAGGGALMTPMLIFLFGVTPTAAISSDLVAAIFMRPVGAAVHFKRGTVHMRMVGWLALGAAPSAVLGAYLLHLLGNTKAAQTDVETVLGAALLVGAAGMVLRALWRRPERRASSEATDRTGGPGVELPVRPLATVLVGIVGGVMVGMTSVGSGSLMIVLLLFLYPTLSSSQLVGTDLVQAIPLTAAAALGQLLFGHVVLAVTASVVIGSVPAVFVGSLLSSRAPDRIIRPVITGVIVVSGLKYAGLGDAGLGVAAVVVAIGCGAWMLVGRRERDAVRSGELPTGVTPTPGPAPVG